MLGVLLLLIGEVMQHEAASSPAQITTSECQFVVTKMFVTFHAF